MYALLIFYNFICDVKDHGDHDGDNMNSANSKDKEESINSASTRFNPLSYNGGPITRARAKKMKEAIMGLILHHLEPMLKSQSQMVKGQGQHMVNLNPSPTYVHVIQASYGPKSMSTKE